MWVAQASENGSHTQRGGSLLKRLLIGAPALVLLLTKMIPLTSRVHAASLPGGERILRQNILEPVFDDTTGNVTFVMTPINAPLHAKPASWAPFYVPVYPVGASVGTLQCAHLPADNCPDHGPQIAGAAASIVPAVYDNGVLGHDHLMAVPGSGGDFNIAWEPILVLFTTATAANTRLTTLAHPARWACGPDRDADGIADG